jgi:hypothetical protein
MEWIIHQDLRSEWLALEFCREIAKDVDTTNLKSIRINVDDRGIPEPMGGADYQIHAMDIGSPIYLSHSGGSSRGG